MTIRIAMTVLVFAMLFTITSSSAFADGPDSDKPVSNEYKRQRDTPTGILAPIISLFSGRAFDLAPSMCNQSAKTPKQWGSTNKVRGEVRVTCEDRVPEMYHTAELLRWQGFTGGGWQEIGHTGVFNGTNARRGSAYGTTTCTDHRFKVSGEGYIRDVDGVKYLTGTTSRIADDPCGLG